MPPQPHGPRPLDDGREQRLVVDKPTQLQAMCNIACEATHLVAGSVNYRPRGDTANQGAFKEAYKAKFGKMTFAKPLISFSGGALG